MKMILLDDTADPPKMMTMTVLDEDERQKLAHQVEQSVWSRIWDAAIDRMMAIETAIEAAAEPECTCPECSEDV